MGNDARAWWWCVEECTTYENDWWLAVERKRIGAHGTTETARQRRKREWATGKKEGRGVQLAGLSFRKGTLSVTAKKKANKEKKG